ncbi:hypothetical protein D3C78_1600890 [compost metagenome]
MLCALADTAGINVVVFGRFALSRYLRFHIGTPYLRAICIGRITPYEPVSNPLI